MAFSAANCVHVLGRRARITREFQPRGNPRAASGTPRSLEPCLNTDATFLLPSDAEEEEEEDEEDEEDEQMKARP
ncbi:hypothetical protein EYF80_023834 [Liparis tanakae]|uniref:Uncharacterized protein n=1 Tax=Liparis tanakae TaxID=230148 RepID=A0A4Z2HK44_9TELE|nr:hypothetical protein EYF80_023834 [Liparis tanakae]